MRENLIFYGLPDSPRESENCESLVKELISTKLDIDTVNMSSDRAHRLG